METPRQIRLSIVLLNYNRLDETRQTVERLLAMAGERPDIEIIAVDNNSVDGTAEYLENQEGVRAVLLRENNGIAGYNKGFALAAGEYILVLDDDSCPLDAATLNRIVALLDKNPEMGVLACHIETPAGEPQWKWHLPREHRFGISPFFIGCGFAIRRRLFEQIGWYPENFFIYQNEIDVSFKVRMHGFEIYYDPECRVVHRGVPSQRPGRRCVYYPTRNTIWLIRRYYPRPAATYMLLSRLLVGLGRAVYLRQMEAFRSAVQDGFSEPIERQRPSRAILRQAAPFFRQNSIVHQTGRMT